MECSHVVQDPSRKVSCQPVMKSTKDENYPTLFITLRTLAKFHHNYINNLLNAVFFFFNIINL